MRCAIVHEWLEKLAGAEQVTQQFLRTFPNSELFAIVDFLNDEDRIALGASEITTSFVQRLPLACKQFRNYLPLMPSAVEQFDVSDYDVVISSNHAVAKGVITRPDQLHVSYVHTPIRYAWELQHEYLRQARITRGFKSAMVRLVLHYMRMWDRLAADRVDVFVANSKYIARRIKKTYRRDAEVVYPPVDLDRFSLGTRKDDFYLAASRLVPYKRMDLIVDAFTRMPDRQLVVIGEGTEYDKIAARATPNITILGYQPTEVLHDHMQRARGFVFAAEEDFGITPVEAQACGTPVIAYGKGGARETVREGRTGLFFDRQSADSIVNAIDTFERHRHSFDPHQIRNHAEFFSTERFCQQIKNLVELHWSTHESAPTRERGPATETIVSPSRSERNHERGGSTVETAA